MSVVSVVGWKGITPENKKRWVKACTLVMKETLQESLDEIVVYINEIENNGWGQAGVLGNDKEWLTKSVRR
ncbi:MAG: tautomerase family protein [Anaerocolumna sp.]